MLGFVEGEGLGFEGGDDGGVGARGEDLAGHAGEGEFVDGETDYGAEHGVHGAEARETGDDGCLNGGGVRGEERFGWGEGDGGVLEGRGEGLEERGEEEGYVARRRVVRDIHAISRVNEQNNDWRGGTSRGQSEDYLGRVRRKDVSIRH